MYCLRCGHAIAPAQQFCAHCGTRIESVTSSGSVPAKGKNWLILVLVGITLLLLIILPILFPSPGTRNQQTATSADKSPAATSATPGVEQANRSAARKSELAAALRTVSVQKDPAEQLEFYYPKPRPIGGVYVYIGKSTTDAEGKYLRLFVRKYSPNVFYADELNVLVDGTKMTLSLSPFRDSEIDPNAEGDGALQADIPVEASLLRRIASGHEIYVSLKNDSLGQRTSFKMTEQQKKSIEHMLDVYDLL